MRKPIFTTMRVRSTTLITIKNKAVLNNERTTVIVGVSRCIDLP